MRREPSPAAALRSQDLIRPCQLGLRRRVCYRLDALPAEQADESDARIAIRKMRFQPLGIVGRQASVDVGRELLLVRARRAALADSAGRGAQQGGQFCRAHDGSVEVVQALKCHPRGYTDARWRFASRGSAFISSARAWSAAWICRFARNGSGNLISRATSSSVRFCW